MSCSILGALTRCCLFCFLEGDWNIEFDVLFQPTSPPHSEHSFATPTSGGARKRRRRRDGVGRTSGVATPDVDLASGCLPSGTSPCMHPRKRPSTETSFSSLLDISNTPETSLLGACSPLFPIFIYLKKIKSAFAHSLVPSIYISLHCNHAFQ